MLLNKPEFVFHFRRRPPPRKIPLVKEFYLKGEIYSVVHTIFNNYYVLGRLRFVFKNRFQAGG